jgi:hypothetical protein
MSVPTEERPLQASALGMPAPVRAEVDREEAATRSRRRRHREMLLIALAATFLPFVLDVLPNQRVAFRGLRQFPLPETCMARSVFGVSCPGCGLTRSFIYLARGDWQHALALHRLGWLLAAAVLLQFPYRLYALRRGNLSVGQYAAARWFGYTLLALLVGNWLWDLVRFR